VDCFYVYPTVSAETAANADLTIQATEIAVARAQAERFSRVCRVWAPMYRQQTLADLTRSGLSGDPTAVRIAYASVLSAWRDYLAHDNNGRPVVFIGHSQGAAILIRLLASQIDPVAARRTQMISAIILGGNVQVIAGRDTGGSFQHIPACRSATQQHCVIAYSSFNRPPPATSLFGRPGQGVSLQSGQRTKVGQQVLCTNPAALAGGIGTLDPYFLAVGRTVRGRPIDTPWVTYPNMYAARCDTADGATWVQITHIGGVGDVRPLVKPLQGPDWGLHVDDVNIALGNLVTIVAQQTHAEPS
jgi:pimeloyl-ACP methyl ester carboxylesterase